MKESYKLMLQDQKFVKEELRMGGGSSVGENSLYWKRVTNVLKMQNGEVQGRRTCASNVGERKHLTSIWYDLLYQVGDVSSSE